LLIDCDLFVGNYVNGSSLGAGYEQGYSGGAMRSASYAAKAVGPYGGLNLCFLCWWIQFVAVNVNNLV